MTGMVHIRRQGVFYRQGPIILLWKFLIQMKLKKDGSISITRDIKDE